MAWEKVSFSHTQPIFILSFQRDLCSVKEHRKQNMHKWISETKRTKQNVNTLQKQRETCLLFFLVCGIEIHPLYFFFFSLVVFWLHCQNTCRDNLFPFVLFRFVDKIQINSCSHIIWSSFCDGPIPDFFQQQDSNLVLDKPHMHTHTRIHMHINKHSSISV